MRGYGFPFRMREWRWKLAGHHSRPLPPEFVEPLRGAKALEIGGPSAIFRSDGRLPVYSLVARLDGCNFAADTVWDAAAGTEYRPEGDEPTGRQWILEAANLEGLSTGSYDALLASHVIEHLANPLRALEEWRRVVRPGGHLLLVIPHKEGTFDHRRPVTTLEHLVEDHRRGVGEDDQTHLEEVLALHDLGRDPELSDREELEGRSRDNLRYRAMHHHVFTTGSALALLDRAALRIVAVEPRWRHDICVLASVPQPGRRPDNRSQLDGDASWLRKTPFRADRRSAGAMPPAPGPPREEARASTGADRGDGPAAEPRSARTS
jgi:SAM-dependent methyltransferase